MWLGRDGSRRARGDDGFEKSEPQPDDWRRIGEYVVTALAVFALCEGVLRWTDNRWISYAFNIVAFAMYAAYLVRRERIDVGAMLRSVLKRG